MIVAKDKAIAIATEWIRLWNDCSIEEYMSQYSEDIELVSSIALRLFPDSNGRLKDKTLLQNYWSLVREKFPNYKFDILDIKVYDNKAIVYYTSKDKTMKAIAILTINACEKINKVEVSYC